MELTLTFTIVMWTNSRCLHALEETLYRKKKDTYHLNNEWAVESVHVSHVYVKQQIRMDKAYVKVCADGPVFPVGEVVHMNRLAS